MSRRIAVSWIGLAYLLFSAAPLWSQETLRWETDLASAQRLAAQTNRLVLVHFWGTWCGPCVRMEQEVFSKPGLGTAISPYYVPVKIQCEDGFDNPLAKQFDVQAFPCDVMMTAQGQIVNRSKGMQSAEAYVAMLQQTAQSALAQARTVGAPATVGTSSVVPVAATTPVTPAAQPVIPTTAPTIPAAPPLAARTAASDDRYANYRAQLPGSPTAPPAAPIAAPVAPPIAAAVTPAVPAPPAAAAPVAPAAAPSAAPAPAAATQSVVGDRYAVGERYTTVTPPSTPAPPPVAAAPQLPPTAPPIAPPTAAPSLPVAPPPAPTVAQNGLVPSQNNVVRSGVPLPDGCPPLALDGYCPVTVTEKMSWKRGDVKFGAIHRGRTYLFLSTAEQQKFLADPDRFSPVMSGNDPVVALEKGDTVNGSRKYGLMYEDRMFLFSSKESYDIFCKDSKRYGTQTFQAMQAGGDATLRR